MTRRASLAAFAPGATQRTSRQLTPEGAVKKQILDGLRAHGIEFRRLGVGSFHAEYKGKRRFVRLSDPGIPDLLVFLPVPYGLGFCEIKAVRGRLSPDQANFRNICIKHQVPHCVARSFADVEQWLAAYGWQR